ncbi:hypothetical protein [Acinetobacter sp. WCHAc010052]|uniref:hypothetical protein n=1 Tax=Acinetobacter sp. WCHAc010052 TaxID=2004647 RepID=UPI000B3D30F2|nr:hypothetical protein [Acinetobacter sp. WCHAc010052]AXY59450.1 hypothetical protein CDG61_05035 [Acinetobacter sp. WCHAc010052]
MKKALLACCMAISGYSYADISTGTGLIGLSDSELSQVEGAALFKLEYTAPAQAHSTMKSQNIGFYKLGLDAVVELNANIKSLKLGCGGINGAGNCDIDIDNLSLSGPGETSADRVNSSAQLTNPFIQFAIKNPQSAATREIMGFRLSAEKAMGLLTAGTENSDKPNGINTLSGAIKIKETTGTASTRARGMSYADTNMPISGRIDLVGLGSLTSPGFETKDYNLQLDSAQATLKVNRTTLSGNRMTSAKLTGTADIKDLNFGGNITASVKLPLISLIPIGINANGYISGLKANLDIDEDLGFIHKLPLNNPFSLSLQKQQIHWTGAEVAAQRGWWMAIEDEIDIGQVTPSNPIDVTNDILKQVVPQISDYLTKNPPSCALLGCLIAGLDIGKVDLSSANPLYFPIKDLQLATQNFAPNCYGGLRYC